MPGELGAGFVRILGYFREDGVKSVQRSKKRCAAMNAARWCCRRTH